MNVLAYSALKETDDIETEGWHKDTINYVTEKRDEIMKYIRSLLKWMSNVNFANDAEDIYYETLLYLYKCKDYSVEEAVEYGRNTPISLEQYVNICIRYCIRRHISEYFKREKGLIREEIWTGEEYGSIFDLIPDRSDPYENVGTDLKAALKALEPKRYLYKTDIYQLLFIRLLTIENDENYERVLEVLDIKDTLRHSEMENDKDVLMAVKAIALAGRETSLKELRPYVYRSGIIINAMQLL